ncbi:hypothetical protein K2Y11_08680, partial [bacterium]|nr:hypothetical protein [bacterium]
RATADWVVGQLREIGIKSQAKIKESEAAGTRRSEFKLPDGIHAITEAESRALLGDRQAISPSSLQKLIQEGKAYEETFQLWGSHVVVLYVRHDDGTIRTLLIRNDGEVVYRLHYFLPPRQAALVYFFEIDVDLKDAEKAKSAITAPDINRTPLRIADAINQVETDPTRIIDLIREFVDANIPGEGKELANAILDFVALIPPEHVALILDFLQLMLDIVGMFPGAGEPADLANAAISAERGQILDAALSAASAIPVAGNIPGLGKALWRLKTIFDLVTNLPTSLRGLFLELLGGIQEELLSITVSKIPDLVRALKRRITDAAQKLRLLSKKADNVPSPTTASHFTPPSSIGRNPSPSKSFDIQSPPTNPKPDSKISGTADSKPKSDSGSAETPPRKSPPPAPKKVESASNTKQGPKVRSRPAPIKKAKKATKKKASRKGTSARKQPQSRKRKDSGTEKDRAKRKKGNSKSPREKVAEKGPSGYGYVRRKNMPSRTIKVGNRDVAILGSPHSSSKTRGHDAAIEAKAEELAKSGKYDYVLMQRSWRTATGRVSKHNKIPDVIGVRLDGRIDAYEIKSKRDTCKTLKARLKRGMSTLSKDRRGDFGVINVSDPDAIPIQPKPEKSKIRKRKSK